MRSFLLKLCMLTATMGLVFWIGWNRPTPMRMPVGSESGSTAVPASSVFVGDFQTHPRSPSTGASTAAGLQAPNDGAKADPTAPHGLLDLNRAGPVDLESLPGVGHILAERMIAYRTSVGGFRTVQQLREVKGIGAKKFDRIKSLVMVTAQGLQE